MDPPPATGSSRRRGRGAVAILLGVLGLVALLASTLAVWARVTLFDSDEVAAIVGEALDEAEVQTALATYLTDQALSAIDVDSLLESALPTSLQRLGPAIAGGIDRFVEKRVAAALAEPQVQDLISALVRQSHEAAMRLLRGDGLVDGITVADGEVSVNLLPLIDRGIGFVQDMGLLTSVDLPEMTRAGDPAEQLAELEQALGRDLADDFGQLVVYRSDTLASAEASVASAQRALVLARRGLWALLVLTAVLLVASVLVARDRWRALLWLGLGGVAVMVIARSAAQRVVDELPSLIVQPGARAALGAMADGAADGLQRVCTVALVVAAALAVVAVVRRRRYADDLVVVAAILAGVLAVAVIGFGLVSVVVAIALVLAVLAVAPRVV